MKMLDALQEVIPGIECLIGILGHALIVGVNVLDWKRSKKLNISDIILTSLGVFRLFLLSTKLVQHAIHLSLPDDNETVGRILLAVDLSLGYTCFWLTTWLYVFYCVRIASFTHLVFLWLKERISRLIPLLMACSVVISLASGLPTPWYFYHLCYFNTTDGTSISEPDLQDVHSLEAGGCYYEEMVYVYTLGYALPFVIFCISSSLLVASLGRHTWQMGKSNDIGLGNSHKVAHYRAVTSVLAFTFIFLVYFIILIFKVTNSITAHSFWEWFSPIVEAAYPSAHCVILILSNSKLRVVTTGILCCMSCKTKQSASSNISQIST
ncbi:taste receptor type 2 member 40-like [Pleurodeles waltl]|uniref:taste receptor type 2 member 40-like n=1 Tax=Pleurodeles waltl TaxID=8319 RepID=UPI00370970C8